MKARAGFSRLWLPLVAGLLGLAGTAALFYALREHDAAHAREIGAIAATSIRNDMEADLNAHFLSQLQALVPTSNAGRISQEEWEAEARLFLKVNPAFVALEWLDAADRRVWGAPAYPAAVQVAADERLRRLDDAVASQPRGMALSSPAPMGDGERLRQLVVPARRNGRLQGFVVAWVGMKGLLDVVLDDATSLGYCISVQEDGKEIYRAPEAKAGCGEAAEIIEVHSVPLNWRARIWPMPEYAHHMRSKAPSLALILGACFSFLLSLTTYFAESAQLRNANLTAEIAEREKTQEELQRTQRELETRVEARTAELSKLSGELLELRDQERRRVSHQLQEGTAQHLAALALNLAVLEQLSDASNENIRTAVQRSLRLIQQSCEELGDLAAVLHPPVLEHLGLDATIRWYVESLRLRTGQQVEIELQPELGRLSRQRELALFRIVQEGLALLHELLPASPARLEISRTGSTVTLEMQVERAAEGAEVRPGALERGLAGMRERARQLGGTVQANTSQQAVVLRAELPAGSPASGGD